MSICIQDIAKSLNAKTIIHVPEYTFIQDVCILVDNQNEFKKDTVYIGAISTCFEINNSNIINLICLDTDIDSFQSLPHLNIIIITGTFGISEILTKIKNLIEDDYISNSSLELYKALASNNDIQYILDVALSIFNNPILVADTSFKLLAHSEISEDCDALWLEISKKGIIPKNISTMY